MRLSIQKVNEDPSFCLGMDLQYGLNLREVYRFVYSQLVVPPEHTLYVFGRVDGEQKLLGMKEGSNHDLPGLLGEWVGRAPIGSLAFFLVNKGAIVAKIVPAVRPLHKSLSVDVLVESSSAEGGQVLEEMSNSTMPF